jgi:hypothetical protein
MRADSSESANVEVGKKHAKRRAVKRNDWSRRWHTNIGQVIIGQGKWCC